MTNSNSLALLSLLALLALTIWRIHSGRVTDKYRTAWAAGLLALLIAFASSFNPGLGAAIGFALAVGILGTNLKKGTPGGAAVGGALATPAGPSTGTHGSSGAYTGPAPNNPALVI